MTPLKIDSSYSGTGGIAVLTKDDIYLQEVAGDLNLVTPIDSQTADASIYSAEGDINIVTVNGRILDAYYESTQQPEDEVLAELEAGFALTGSDAENEANQQLEIWEKRETETYHRYWRIFRNAKKWI